MAKPLLIQSLRERYDKNFKMITLLLQLPAKCLVELSKVELSQHHGERGHPALQGVLEHVALEAEADHHEGKSKACDHEAHSDHIPEVIIEIFNFCCLFLRAPSSLPDNVVVHDAEVSSTKRITPNDEDQLKPSEMCDRNWNNQFLFSLKST